MSIEVMRCSRFVFTLFSYPEYVWITYHRRPVSGSSAEGVDGGTTSGWASTTGAAATGSASATAPARRNTLLTSSTDTSSSGSAVPRNARAASAAASSESLAASTSASASAAGSVDSGCSSPGVRSSRSSLMTLPLGCRRRRYRRRRRALVQQDVVHEVREELIGPQDVGGHDRRDDDDDHGQANDRLTIGPRDLLQLRPALLREADDSNVPGATSGRRLRPSSHYCTAARRERLELSTAGFGDQCSTS